MDWFDHFGYMCKHNEVRRMHSYCVRVSVKRSPKTQMSLKSVCIDRRNDTSLFPELCNCRQLNSSWKSCERRQRRAHAHPPFKSCTWLHSAIALRALSSQAKTLVEFVSRNVVPAPICDGESPSQAYCNICPRDSVSQCQKGTGTW